MALDRAVAGGSRVRAGGVFGRKRAGASREFRRQRELQFSTPRLSRHHQRPAAEGVSAQAGHGGGDRRDGYKPTITVFLARSVAAGTRSCAVILHNSYNKAR